MNTKDQASEDSDEAQELRVLANALENGGELSRSERRTVAAALRHSPPSVQVEGKLQAALHEAATYGIGATSDTNQKIILRAAEQLAATPDHAAVAEALERARSEIVVAMSLLSRDHGTNRLAGTVASLIDRLAKANERARTALSMSKAPQAGGATSSDGGVEANRHAALQDVPAGVTSGLGRLASGPSDAPQSSVIADQYAAVNATAGSPPSSRAEPVAAWQWRYVGQDDSQWKMADGLPTDGRPIEQRPLYASPLSSRAEVVEECAKIADRTTMVATLHTAELKSYQMGFNDAAKEIAAAIRALAQPAVGRDGTMPASFPSKLTTGDRPDGASGK